LTNHKVEGPKKPDQQSVCHVGLLKADNMGERKG